MARMLRAFGIRPMTVWPAQRQPSDKSSRGYYAHQFAEAWRSYCDDDGAPQLFLVRDTER